MKKFCISIAFCAVVFFCPAFAQMTMVWNNDTAFLGPESVVYDGQNNCLYVSNFNRNPKNGDNYNEYYVSKADLKGTLIEKKFVGNLTSPTGLCINNGKLYIVERFGIVQFDIETKRVETRYRITGPGFLNDVAFFRQYLCYRQRQGNDLQNQQPHCGKMAGKSGNCRDQWYYCRWRQTRCGRHGGQLFKVNHPC